MTHLEQELSHLKADLIEMFYLVQKQLKKSINALHKMDKDLAREVLFNEKRVNAGELKIDTECEQIAALFNPVAVDLRFVFSAFKMNSHLESIGDSAKVIAKWVNEMTSTYDRELLENIQFQRIYDMVNSMIENNLDALENDDTDIARRVFIKDEEIDNLNRSALPLIAAYIREHPDLDLVPLLNLVSIVRRLERVGDLSCNISEEIIFYVEAKVLKHSKRKEKGLAKRRKGDDVEEEGI